MESFFFQFVILVAQILVVLSQGIPPRRTMEICSGLSLTLKFDEVTYRTGNIVSWHFTPAGSNEETDIGLVRSNGNVQAVGTFQNRTLKRVGDLGMELSDMRISDTGLYRVSQDPNLRYDVTVRDPCLNSSISFPEDGKTCVEINCQSRGTFLRFEVEGDKTENITQNPNKFCGTSVTSVTCFVEVQGMEMSNKTSVDLKVISGGDGPNKNSEGLGSGPIVGIVLGSLGGIGIVGAIIYILMKRSSNSKGFHIP